MSAHALKTRFQKIAAETLEIADAAAQSVDRFLDTSSMPPHERLQALEALQAEIQQGHCMALTLTRHLPSPNAVAPVLSPSVVIIGKSLFNFVRLCEIRQNILAVMHQDIHAQTQRAG